MEFIPGATSDSSEPRTSPQVHDGPCGPRAQCWRPQCRVANGAYRTVEFAGGLIVAHCHGAIHGADTELRADLWRTFRNVAA